MPKSPIARRNAATVRPARSRKHAFRIAAFSRSSRPIRPISCDRVTENAGHRRRQQLRRSFLHLAIDRGEDGGDGDRRDPLGGDIGGGPLDLVLVEGRNLAAVELVTAVAEIAVAAEGVAQIARPIDHRRQRGGRRQTETDRCRRLHTAAAQRPRS